MARPWIFVHVPKTGGTSVEASLPGRFRAHRQRDRHATAQEIRKELNLTEPGVWDAALKIAVVRNPWDRAVSAWAYQKERTGAQDFPDWLWRGRPMLSQWNMVAADGRVIVDHLIRFEDLAAGFARAVELIGCEPCELLHLNPSRLRVHDLRRTYRDYYTAERFVRLIEEQYPKDVSRFGYRF